MTAFFLHVHLSSLVKQVKDPNAQNSVILPEVVSELGKLETGVPFSPKYSRSFWKIKPKISSDIIDISGFIGNTVFTSHKIDTVPLVFHGYLLRCHQFPSQKRLSREKSPLLRKQKTRSTEEKTRTQKTVLGNSKNIEEECENECT